VKKRGLLKVIIGFGLVAVLAISIPLVSSCAGPVAPVTEEPWVCGYIGAFDTDVGKSAMRGTEIAVEELNASGGILGRQIKLVKADSAEDITEGIKAMEYLNDVENVDFMVSGCVDDVSLGWFPRLAEYQVPLMETWTSAIRCIEQVHDEYDKYQCYFMDHMNDYDQGAEYVAFANDVLGPNGDMGWDTCVIFFEDTAYGGGVAEYVRDEIAPGAGINPIGEVMYDIDTFDFSPVYAQIVSMDPDFIYHISSVNCIPPSAAYVELQVPLPITGVNVAAASKEFWDDMGGMAGGFSSISPPPCLGMDFDPPTQAFINKYEAKYTTRPVFPHFDGFNAYWGVLMMAQAAEHAGGFEPLNDWVKEMEKTDLKLWLNGGFEAAGPDDILWQNYKFYGPEHDYTHSQVLDTTGENGRPGGMVMQWYPDETVKVIHPYRWKNGEFYLPDWIPEDKR
jgi:ABC-type branched-subunit amino acid transport system substrate-binding protein